MIAPFLVLALIHNHLHLNFLVMDMPKDVNRGYS